MVEESRPEKEHQSSLPGRAFSYGCQSPGQERVELVPKEQEKVQRHWMESVPHARSAGC